MRTLHRLSPLRRAAAVTATAGLLLAGSGLVGAATAAGIGGAQLTNIDRPVPAGATLLPDGRLATPAGRTVDLGDFPVGLAISPDGTLAAAPGDGQGSGLNAGFGSLCQDVGKPDQCGYVPSSQQGDPATPSPDEALFVADLRTLAETEVKAVPTSHDPAKPRQFNFFAMGTAFAPDGRTVYATGGGNDAVYAFPVGGGSVGTKPSRTVYLQSSGMSPTVGSSSYQAPASGTAAGETKGLAITPDGSELLVLKEQTSELLVLDAATFAVKQDISLLEEPSIASPAATGTGISYPYDVVVAPDGGHAYVSLQGVGTVLTFGIVAGVVTPATVSLVGDHPTGEAVSPDGRTLLVADSNDEQVSLLPLTAGLPGPRATPVTVGALDGEQPGSAPNAVAFAPGGDRAYVALAGDDAVAVLDRSGTTWRQTGAIPTGWYPARLAVAPDGDLVVVNAKGLGSRYVPNGDDGAPAVGGIHGPAQVPAPYYYDGSNMPGLLQIVPPPSPPTLKRYTQQVRDDIAYAQQHNTAATGPVPTSQATAGQSPITHVVYVVRENRTYDQVLGDEGAKRDDVDGDPSLTSLAAATPNAHGVLDRYATSDSFFSDGEASVQGHFWTSSADVDDYVEKDWRQYYSDRNHSDDTISVVGEPAGCSIFQAAQAKSAATGGRFSYFDFGEPVGIANPSVAPAATAGALLGAGAGAVTTPGPAAQDLARSACAEIPNAMIDPRGFTDGFSKDNRPLATDFLTESGLNADGSQTAAGSSGAASLRNFSYVELPGDHTTGYTAGQNTPRSEVARNDAALGTIIGALSRSKYWSSTAVVVQEDDSQDGPDHVDGHRNVLLVASPYARQLSANGCYTGYVSHVHYDQASVLRTVELILGLPPLSSFDANAAPLYDMFQPISSAAQLTPADLAPYTPTAAPAFVDETVDGLPKTAQNAALVRQSKGLDLQTYDLAGPGLEQVLWSGAHPGRPLPAQLANAVTTWDASVRGAELGGATPQQARAGSADDDGGPLPFGDLNPAQEGAAPAAGYTETQAQLARGVLRGAAADPALDACTAPGRVGQRPPPASASGAGSSTTTNAGGELAFTGLRTLPVGIVGLVLLAAGGAALWTLRRRSS